MSRICTHYAPHSNESCHTSKWVKSHTWMSQVTHMSHFTHMHQSCSIFEWVMSHTKMSQVTHMNESCRNYESSHIHVQPIADRVAQNLEIISKNYQFSTKHTRFHMGFMIYYLVLIVNPMAEFYFVEKVLEIISRFCATLSAIGCTRPAAHTNESSTWENHCQSEEQAFPTNTSSNAALAKFLKR